MGTAGVAESGTSRVLTVPNLISVARLLCVPLFLWLLFGRDNRIAAAGLLAGLGATDWVDGWIARRFNQVSDIGKVLDPTADRIMLAVGVIAIWVDGGVPDVIFWPVVVREIAISLVVVGLAAAGAARMDVIWAGKAGTFALMFAFPFFLLSEAETSTPGLWEFLAWGWALPGLVLGYIAAAEYARGVPGALREGRRMRETQ